MDEVTKQVNRARRSLGVQRFAELAGWCLFGTLMVALAVVVLDKYRPLGIDPWVCVALAGVVGILLAGLIAYVRGRGSIDAAIEIDQRFGLKERVSSTLAMTPGERETEIGQALVADAEKRVKRIDVREHFGVRPGGQLLLPLLPLTAAVLVILLVSQAVIDEEPQANAASMKKQVTTAAGELQRKLIEQRKEAEKSGLKDAEMLFQRLSEETEDLARSDDDSRKDALVKLNDLKRQMENRQKQIGGAEEIRKKLDKLNTNNRGPADNFMKSISQGDMKKAMEALDKLKKDMADGNLSKEDQEQLKKQLEAMKDKLEEEKKKHEEKKKELENKIQQAQQAGDAAEASKLQDQLNSLAAQDNAMQQLQKMAEQLGECAECMQNGQMQDAADMLEQMQGDLADMQQQLDEMQMLDDAMDQLCQARDQMNCGQCQGQGCGACQGDMPGRGMGPGQGMGDRPEEENPTGFYDTKVKQKIGQGSATIAGEVEGPNIKGNVLQAIEEQLETAKAESADPLTGQQMPRRHQEHTKDYFDRFREGE